MNYEKFARGVEIAVDGKHVYLKIDPKAKKEVSSSGKMDLTTSTGGFKDVDGFDGFRLSVMAGYKK